MLTRCPACATHFRVTAEQLKARSGRVRCGECQHAFNALDALIEEPMSLPAPRGAKSAPLHDAAQQTTGVAQGEMQELAALPAPWATSGTPSPITARREAGYPLENREPEALSPKPDQIAGTEDAEAKLAEHEAVGPVVAPPEAASSEAAPSDAAPPDAAPPETVPPEAVPSDAALSQAVQPAMAEQGAAEAGDWTETFPEPPPPPRRWPWVIGGLVALTALGLQAVLAFRVELAVLWPEARPALVALCEVVDCEVGLPAKVTLVGIEASDLHPDSEHPGRLALTATIRSRAPFAQQFPHLELTLTDTADKAVVRKILAPADYLPPQTPIAQGMPPNADIMVTVGIDSGEAAANGYRLYVFYP